MTVLEHAFTAIIDAHRRYRIRVVGVDPGIRNLFLCYAADGSTSSMSQGEFMALSKLDVYLKQLADAVKKAKLPDLPAIHHSPAKLDGPGNITRPQL